MKIAGASHVRIFGSIVRGEYTTSSDIDFLVDFDTSPGLVPIVNLKTALSALLKEKVDVTPASLLKKSVFENASKEAVPLRSVATMNFELKIFSIVFSELRLPKRLRDLLAHQYFQIDVAVIKASIE